jgi:hypothetical protein
VFFCVCLLRAGYLSNFISFSLVFITRSLVVAFLKLNGLAEDHLDKGSAQGVEGLNS